MSDRASLTFSFFTRHVARAAVALPVLLVACGGAPSTDVEHQPTGGTSQGTPAGSSPTQTGSSSSGTPTTPSTPAPAPLTGNVYVRVANFTANAADVCLSPDAGATWIGPIMSTLSGAPAAASAVTERMKFANAHFTARIVGGTTCTTPLATDMVIPDMPGEWPATAAVGTSAAGTPGFHFLLDEPSLSNSATFIRLVQTAHWSMNADLDTITNDCCCGQITTDVFGNTPYLGTAKMGTLSPQGYAALDPLQNASLILLTTATQQQRLEIDNFNTDVNQKFTFFTMGDDTTTTLLQCDDAADPTADHLTPCQTLDMNGN